MSVLGSISKPFKSVGKGLKKVGDYFTDHLDVTGFILGGVPGYLVGSYLQSNKEANRAMRRNQKEQNRLLEQQNEQALATRRNQIDQMRESLGVGSYRTDSAGYNVSGYLGDKLG